MVSQNIEHMDLHYWLIEQMTAEIITTDIMAAKTKKCQKFFSAGVTEFTKSCTNFVFI